MRPKPKDQSSDAKKTKEFEELYRRNYPRMFLLAELLLKKNALPENTAHELAAVAVQETFIVAWQKWKAFVTHPAPEAWLYEVLRHKTLRIVRDEWNWRKRMLQLSENSKVFHIETTDTFTTRVGLQELLTEEEYRILVQLYLEGKTYEELSKEMQMKKSTLAMRVKRIKERLQKKFFYKV